MPTPTRPLVLFALATLLSFAAGCSSPPEPEHQHETTVAPADLPPVMAGTETFAGGKIIVKVTLAMPGYYHGKDGDQPGSSGSGSGRHGGGGGGGGGRHHGGGDAPPPGAGGDGSSDDSQQHIFSGSNLPPAQLILSLQNTSATDDVKCEVVDFNSYLGDFAVFPGRYHLAAGQTAASEAMTSRLGVQGAEIPVTVALRIGDQTESKVVTLRQLNPPADPAK
jgi:hypothetical protein